MSITLEEILKEKEAGNNFLMKNDFLNAEKSYKETLGKIELLPEEKKNEPEIKKQTTFIMSNLSNTLLKLNKVKESMDYDRKIIKKYDEHFAKSYARLVDGYLKLDKLAMARYHYDMMKRNVPAEIRSKFPEVINKIESKITSNDEMANSLLALKGLLNS